MFCPALSWPEKLLEAAKAWGYKLYEWDRESFENKAIVLGFHLWTAHRDGYEMAMQKQHAKGGEEKDQKQQSHQVYRHREAMLRDRLQKRDQEGT